MSREDRRAYKDLGELKDRRALKATTINRVAVNEGGFRCDLCSASFTSYNALLDHKNSRIHQKNAGGTAVERVDDPARIRARLDMLRAKKLAKKGSETGSVQVAEERAQSGAKTQEKRPRPERGQQSAPAKDGPPDDESALMVSLLGISSFK